jgi:predicted SAM-dependent methyltransferase
MTARTALKAAGASVSVLTSAASWLRRKRTIQALPAADGSVRVNLGCGLTVAPGWINVDGSINALIAAWPTPVQRAAYELSGAKRYFRWQDYRRILSGHTFVQHDLTFSVPFSDASVDFVYSSHFLEHLGRDQGARLLAEMHRVLRTGGVARVCVPDLAYVVGLYGTGAKRRMLDEYVYVREGTSAFSQHRYLYDFELLSEALRLAGFAVVERCARGHGRTPDLAALDVHGDDTLFVEALKQ